MAAGKGAGTLNAFFFFREEWFHKWTEKTLPHFVGRFLPPQSKACQDARDGDVQGIRARAGRCSPDNVYTPRPVHIAHAERVFCT